MNLNPTVRWLLVGLATAGTAAATILADGFQPLDAIPIVLAFLTGIGVTPPQAQASQGGAVQQQGVVTPKLKARV